ncbi:DUF2752 domain-containing protein [Actinorugispora endophytica]|uniref:Uncharacterized protein DUF2752 n=1 Tax=Actinorugispora endophytica TaxID=1605990 RepID=A0A4V3D7Q8_9ACTN|nr:DUF2752 domain-containing protein [Actinorugispora endophytica]TDQ48517.1 uncharacterized protein DUF2752 [Actinorugispora endophytica]
MADSSVLARLRRRLHPAAAPLALGALGVAGLVVVHFVDPNEPGHYPTCPWLALTGTYCPGCGSTRAVHALTSLDIVGAAQMNIFLVAALPFLAWAYARWVYGSFRPPARPPRLVHPFWLWSLLAGIVGFWIARNLPFGAFLAPGGALPT